LIFLAPLAVGVAWAAPKDAATANYVLRLLAVGRFEEATAQLDAPELRALPALKARLLNAVAAKPAGPVTLFLRNSVIVTGTITAASPVELIVTKLGNVNAHVRWADLNPQSLHAVLASVADARSADEQLAIGILARAVRLTTQAQTHFAAAFELDPMLASRITFWSGQPLNARQQAVLNAAAQMAALFKGRVRPLPGGRIEVSYDFSRPEQLDDWRAVGGTSNDWQIVNGTLVGTALGADPLLWQAVVTGPVEFSARLNLPKQGYTGIGLAQWADAEPPNGLRVQLAAIKSDQKFALRSGPDWSTELDIARLTEPFRVSITADGRQFRAQVNDASPLTTSFTHHSSLITLRGAPDVEAIYDDLRITCTLDSGWLTSERWLRARTGPPKPVRVDSAKPWQDSRLDLQQGRRYRIVARGEWSRSVLFGGSTADGSGALNNAIGALLRNLSLVGRIGASGRPFQLGSDRTFVSPASGRLFMQVNAPRLDENKGTFDVWVLSADGVGRR